MTAARLLAFDWGTSVLRAYLMGKGGDVIEERRRPWGVMHLPEGGFAGALEGIAGDWRRGAPGLSAIACGMVGSAQGMCDAPYLPCPAGEALLSSALLDVRVDGDFGLHIVPGVRRDGDRPDVMRGEETQIMGVLARAPHLAAGALLIMPGTHSKWVQVQDGRIVDFQTYLTGELFAVLGEHSILGRPARAAREPADEGAFERGVSAILSRPRTGAFEMLFSVRALVLSGQLHARDSLEYMSGLLVGEELRCALLGPLLGSGAPLALVGDVSLCARYQRALTVFGLKDIAVMDDASSRGLWQIAQRAGLWGTT